ncbi:MAG: hypothetical protein GX240_00365 [Candidatus Atribacteria bacterium]|nr:hypothetical protein [Candidatus Atribacteria bacterium]
MQSWLHSIKNEKFSHFLDFAGHPEVSTVVKNTSKDIPQGTLASIRKQLRLTREKFIEIIS